MNYKCKAAIKRSIAFLLVMALMWSESSIVTLASAVTPQTGVEEGAGEPAAEPADEPSEEPEATTDAEPTVTPAQNETENDQSGATPTPTADQTGEESAEPTATPEEGQEEGQDPSATPTPSATPESSPSASPSASPDGVLTVALNANGEGDPVSLTDAYVVKVQDKDGNEITIPSDDDPKVPNGVKISLYRKATEEGGSDVLIDPDDEDSEIERLEWYILAADESGSGITTDDEPVAVNEETLVLNEYTLLETSKVVVRLYPNRKEEDQGEGTEGTTAYTDFDGGYYTATEATNGGDKAAITNTGTRIEAGSRLVLTAKSGTITECYWFRAEETDANENAAESEVMISTKEDYAKTSYRITSADVAENVKSIYAKYKLAGDNTLYKTAELSMTERREVSAKILSVSATEENAAEALGIESVYASDYVQESSYKCNNSYNLVLTRNRSKWEKYTECDRFGAEFELSFEQPVTKLQLSSYYMYPTGTNTYGNEVCIESTKVDQEGYVWKLKFYINPDYLKYANWTATYTDSYQEDMQDILFRVASNTGIDYADGTYGTFNLYVHDLGATQSEVYLASLIGQDSTGSSSINTQGAYTLNKLSDISLNEGASVQYVLAQDGKPYTGSVTLAGEALSEGYVSGEVLAEDEYGFQRIKVTGLKNTLNAQNSYVGRGLNIVTADAGTIYQNVFVYVPYTGSYAMCFSDDIWLFEKEEDVGDYSKSLNVRSNKQRADFGGKGLDYYIMWNPDSTGLTMDYSKKPVFNQSGYFNVTSTLKQTAEGQKYYKCTCIPVNSQYNTLVGQYYSFVVTVSDSQGNTQELYTNYFGIAVMKGDYSKYPYLTGIGMGSLLMNPDGNQVISYDGTTTDFRLILPEGQTVADVAVIKDYKRNGTLTLTSEDKTCFTVTPKNRNMIMGLTISIADGEKTQNYHVLLSPADASANGGNYDSQGKRYFLGIAAEGSESNAMAYVNRTSGTTAVTRLTPAMKLFEKATDGEEDTLVAEGDWFCPFLKSIKAEILTQLPDGGTEEVQSTSDVVWFLDGEDKTTALTFDNSEGALSELSDYEVKLCSGSVTGTALIKYTYTFKSDITVPAALRGKTYAGRVMQVQVIDPEESDRITVPTFLTDENITDEQKAENALMLQDYLNALMRVSKANGNEEIAVSLTQPVQFKGTIKLNSNVRLDAAGSTLEGNIIVTKADGGRVAEVRNLTIKDMEGVEVLIDASEAPVLLDSCDMSVRNEGGRLLQVSGDTYAQTELDNCSATISKGTLFRICAGTEQITGVYRLKSMGLSVGVSAEGASDAACTLVSCENGAVASDAAFDVSGLCVQDFNSLQVLANGGKVVNNVFEVVKDTSGLYANTADITLTDVNSCWLNPKVKGESGHQIGQITVQNTGSYTVSGNTVSGNTVSGNTVSGNTVSGNTVSGNTISGNSITVPKSGGYTVFGLGGTKDVFRPYAEINEYTGKPTGAYASLLPKGYTAYVVFDVNKKSGFPYGAGLAKNVTGIEDGYLVQYHADKTTEIVASITGGKATLSDNSTVTGLTRNDDGTYTLCVDTSNGESEPIVLAFYKALPDNQLTMKVTGNIDEKSGYLLTDVDQELKVVLNNGIAQNYFNDEKSNGNSGEGKNFALTCSKSTMPDGEEITLTVDEDNENIAYVHVPAGTSGSFVISGFYQATEGDTISGNSAKKNFQTVTCTVNMVGVKDVEADAVPYSAMGSKYYGEMTFVVNKDAVSAITDISMLAGKKGEGGYDCALVSTTVADAEDWSGNKSKDRKTYTIQYMVNVGDPETWKKIEADKPVIRIETVAGPIDILLETEGLDLTYTDEANGLMYLFEESSEETLGTEWDSLKGSYVPAYDPSTDANTLIFTGALITNPNIYYSNPNGTTVNIPDTVTLGETDYSVKYLKNGCLNEIWENGAQRNAPKNVVIPSSAEEILALFNDGSYSIRSYDGLLVTDREASDLEKIMVAEDNKNFLTDADGEVLYQREFSEYDHCEIGCCLREIVSTCYGSLELLPQMIDVNYNADFSDITEFICNNNEHSLETMNGMLVRSESYWDEEAYRYKVRYRLVAIPGAAVGDELVIPEGVYWFETSLLKNLNISTLVLPSTLQDIEFGSNSISIPIEAVYYYSQDTTCNPLDQERYDYAFPWDITFYGYVDESGNSALKSWVAENKWRNFKFVSLNQNSEAEYVVTSSSRKAKTVATGDLAGEQYYEVLVDETLDANFDLKVALTDDYTKRDVTFTAEWNQSDGFYSNTAEFVQVDESDSSKGLKAASCGVAKVNVMVDGNEDPVKSVYFVVRPASFELTVGSENTTIMFGGSGTFNGRGLGTCGQEGTVSSDVVTVSKAAFDEWKSLGLASILIPTERAVTGSDRKVYDVWKIRQKEDDALALTVQPLLYQKKDGTVLGAGTSSVGFELFGQEYSTQVTACKTNNTNGILVGQDYENATTTLYVEGNVLETGLLRKYNGSDTKGETKTISLTECLDPQNGTYVSGEYSYEQFSCEVIEGMELLKDATIGTMTTTAGESGVATLQLTPNDNGKTGKAKVKVTLLYDDRAYSEIFDVIVADRPVIKELNVSAELYLKDKSGAENENGAETFDKDTNELKLVYGGEGSCWFLKELKITDEKKMAISQDLLDFKLTSDTGKAEWITDQSGSKTGIKLTGAGIAVVTITAMDANAATIRCVINVRDTQPKLINSESTINTSVPGAEAEYRFAVPEGLKLQNAVIEKETYPTGKDGNETTLAANSIFDINVNEAVNTVKVTVKADKTPSSGNYQLSVLLSVVADGESADSYTYTYTYDLGLAVTGTEPKLTVTAADTINLNNSKSVLLTTLIDGAEADGVTLGFDTSDTKVTANFAKCFELKKDKESGEHSVVLKDMRETGNAQETPEALVKQFNNKDIVLKVAKNGKNLGTAKVRLKLAYTSPKLTLDDRGTVKVNTADFDSYMETDEAESKRGGYSVRVDYTLSDDFELKLDKDSKTKQSVTIFEWKDKNQFNKYKDDIKFITEGDKFSVWVAADLPKGTYKFEMTPVVTVEGNSNLGDLTLAKQTLTVSVTQTTIKASLSDNKVTLDKNYIYTTADLKLLLDDSQFSSLYGSDYWSEGLDTAKTVVGITLTKAPKNVDMTGDTGICFSVDESGQVTAQIEASQADSIVPGAYTYSVTPYLKLVKTEGDNAEESQQQTYVMALAPLTFTVNVTDTLPTVQLEKNAVTISNADTSSSVLLNWKVTKGSYAAINAGTNNNWVALTKPADSQNAPEVTCEGNMVRIKATTQTLKGTYEYTITPEVTLDNSSKGTANAKPVKPVTLKVTVKGDRPAAKLSKNKLVTNTWYPGTINNEPESVTNDVPESATAVITAGNYKITDVTCKPADQKAQKLLDDNVNAIRFAFNKDAQTIIAVPDPSTRKGSYSFYAYVTAADVGALEPVKFTVEVSDKKPDVKLASTNAQLKTNYAGAVTLQLKDASAVVESTAEQTSYLIKKFDDWKLVPSGKAAVSQAYAVITTNTDGSVTVSTGKKASTLAKSETVKMELTQKISLKGNKTPYELTSKLTIKFDATLPTAVISQKKVELNINTMEGYLPNVVNISTSAGNEIESVGITIGKCPDSGAFTLSYEPVTDGSMNISLSANRDTSGLKTGSYSYTLTPKIRNNAGDLISLKPVTLTVSVVNKQPDVKLGKTSLTLNRLDTRDVSRQTITLTPTIADAEITYEAAVTDAKGTSVDSELLLPYGTFVGNGDDLKIGVTDTYMSDGKYKVNITPTLHRRDGTEVTLKTKTVNVTVNTPVVKAAFRNAKMTIDIADTAVKKQRNTITFTGTNAELINKAYWTVKLTKKPKDAGNNELWIDDLLYDEDGDGKEFNICWGDDTSTWVNVTPGTYEFTFTPDGVVAEDGVEIKAPAALKLSVTVKKSVPTYKLTKSSVKVNATFGQYEAVAAKMSGTGWKLNHVGSVLTGTPNRVSAKDALVDVYYEDGILYAHADAKAVTGKYTFRLTPEVEKNGVTIPLASQNLTVEVKNETPKAKLSGSTLALNTQYAEYYDNDEFGGNRVAVLSLNKNYGDSTFSNVTSEGGKTKVAFTGKAEQKKEANKIFWKLGEDGKLFAGISDESIKPGSYKFSITPAIRCSETGVVLSLNTINVTVRVTDQEIKATAKASGKLDLLERSEAGAITYTISLSDATLDTFAESETFSLQDVPEAPGTADSFEIVSGSVSNEGATATFKVCAKEGAEHSTKTTYKLQIVVRTKNGKTCYIPVSIKPVQSAVKLTADTKAVTLYKQCADTVAPKITVSATTGTKTPKELEITKITSGNENFKIEYPDEDKKDSFRPVFASPAAKAAYKDGAKVKVPVYVTVKDQAVETVNKLEITVTVQ